MKCTECTKKYRTKAELAGHVLLLLSLGSVLFDVISGRNGNIDFILPVLFGIIGLAMAFLGYGSPAHCPDCRRRDNAQQHDTSQ